MVRPPRRHRWAPAPKGQCQWLFTPPYLIFPQGSLPRRGGLARHKKAYLSMSVATARRPRYERCSSAAISLLLHFPFPFVCWLTTTDLHSGRASKVSYILSASIRFGMRTNVGVSRRHKLGHGKPQFQCPGCDRSFHRSDLLARHQQKQCVYHVSSCPLRSCLLTPIPVITRTTEHPSPNPSNRARILHPQQ